MGNVVFDFIDVDGPGGSGATTLAKRYLWGEQVDELVAQEDVTKKISAAGRVLWPIVDQLGTVRDLVKQDGTVATHFVYTAFGDLVSGDTSLTRYLFTSREFDAETELQYDRARWYDGATGRWISEDPLGFAAGDVNTARYVGNGVVEGQDPSGLFWDWNRFWSIYVGTTSGAAVGASWGIMAGTLIGAVGGPGGVAGGAVTGGIGGAIGGAVIGFWKGLWAPNPQAAAQAGIAAGIEAGISAPLPSAVRAIPSRLGRRDIQRRP